MRKITLLWQNRTVLYLSGSVCTVLDKIQAEKARVRSGNKIGPVPCVQDTSPLPQICVPLSHLSADLVRPREMQGKRGCIPAIPYSCVPPMRKDVGGEAECFLSCTVSLARYFQNSYGTRFCKLAKENIKSEAVTVPLVCAKVLRAVSTRSSARYRSRILFSDTNTENSDHQMA